MDKPHSNSLESAFTSKTYSSFVADIALTTAVPTGGVAPGVACRRIRINSAGSGALSIKYADGSTDTITGLQQGDQIDVQAVAILTSGTSVAGVTVFW
jgi:hypothetical protein